MPRKKVEEETIEDVVSSEPAQEETTPSNTIQSLRTRFSKGQILGGIVVLVIIVVVILAGNGVGTSLEDGAETDEEIQEVLGQVSELILLPEGETPTVATVVDAQALIAEQPFYSGVQDGDRLIIYPESLKAIIYSPERDIIVNVGPIQFPQSANEEGALEESEG